MIFLNYYEFAFKSSLYFNQNILNTIGIFNYFQNMATVLRVHDALAFGPLAVKKQNCMHFAEEHCFGCASAPLDCANEYGSFS